MIQQKRDDENFDIADYLYNFKQFSFIARKLFYML